MINKQLFKMGATLAVALILCLPATAKGKVKVTNAQRVSYVLENIDVKRDVKAKLKPLLESYLKEKDAANAAYDQLKDKLKPRLKLGKLTDEQGQQLLNAKWAADEKELAIKKAYEKKFKTILSVGKTFECFDLLNDKKSKVLE